MKHTAPCVSETAFPRAAACRALFDPRAVSERTENAFPWTERHLQALWFDDRLRPAALRTSLGEPVMVENPGRWNLEAGPDFSGAVLRIGREQRRVAGDAEIHISPGDWTRHGHAGDARYAKVRFHITWFSGRADDSVFPEGTIHIALSDVCTADLEGVDPAAYPYAEPRARPVCLPGFPTDPDRIVQLLESAGEERMRRKTLRMARRIQQLGERQALYEETAAALGYKQNKTPFRALARRLPVDTLNARYGSDWKTVCAVMCGLSGLLPAQAGSGWPEASKRELRSLRDIWWREAHRWEETEPLAANEWRLYGVRPLNHPLRRITALAQWTAGGLFRTAEPAEPLLSARLYTFEKCFWSERTGWRSAVKAAELVGKERARAIAVNVLAPARLAGGDTAVLDQLPAEPVNSVIREAAHALFGPDHSPRLYRSALARQGLLLLFDEVVLSGSFEAAISEKKA